MTTRDSQLLSVLARNGQAASTSAYLRATARPGKTLERLIESEQKLPNVPVVLTFVRQEARRIPDRARGGVKLIAMKGPCDAFGTVRATGRSIVFDMKECKAVRSFDAKLDHLPHHQVGELIRHGRAGAIAGLLVLSTRHGWLYWLDWKKLVQRKPTYPWDELEYAGTMHGVNWPAVCRSAAEGGAS
jgi:penicillin-binding protein-related factor A (putative recombinase)